MIMCLQMVFQHSISLTRTILCISNHYVVSAQIKTKTPSVIRHNKYINNRSMKLQNIWHSQWIPKNIFFLDRRHRAFISIINCRRFRNVEILGRPFEQLVLHNIHMDISLLWIYIF